MLAASVGRQSAGRQESGLVSDRRKASISPQAGSPN